MPADEAIVVRIQERLKQHKENLTLWQYGILDPTVEDYAEKTGVMRDLRTAIYELETLLK